MCVKESCFPDCWKVSSVVSVFKNVGEKTTENYCCVGLPSVLSKKFLKIVINKLADNLEKCGLLSDFQYGFRSSRSTAGLLTVVSDRIAWSFNRSEATETVALDIFKAFGWVYHVGLLRQALWNWQSCICSSGSFGWKYFARISSWYWCSSRLHSWSQTFPTIY